MLCLASFPAVVPVSSLLVAGVAAGHPRSGLCVLCCLLSTPLVPALGAFHLGATTEEAAVPTLLLVLVTPTFLWEVS